VHRVRALTEDDRPWLEQQLVALWGSTEVVSRGLVHDAASLSGFVCVADDEIVGLATYDVRAEQCELVTLDAFTAGQGVGSLLLRTVIDAAHAQNCHRLWLITSNDNLQALGFYQRRGLRLVAVHHGAIDEARLLKPQIPLVGDDGIPIHDELELEVRLSPQA
jgi:ribosomal protein S18 acetylase RimI-like enzyme